MYGANVPIEKIYLFHKWEGDGPEKSCRVESVEVTRITILVNTYQHVREVFYVCIVEDSEISKVSTGPVGQCT